MLYFAYLIQKGEGCDYTIGCGRQLLRLRAANHPDAVKELKTRILDKEEGYQDERKLAGVDLLEVITETNIPIEEWYQEIERAKINRERQQQEETERATLAKLKAKYEK